MTVTEQILPTSTGVSWLVYSTPVASSRNSNMYVTPRDLIWRAVGVAAVEPQDKTDLMFLVENVLSTPRPDSSCYHHCCSTALAGLNLIDRRAAQRRRYAECFVRSWSHSTTSFAERGSAALHLHDRSPLPLDGVGPRQMHTSKSTANRNLNRHIFSFSVIHRRGQT